MIDVEKFQANILNDLRTQLTEEFDRNFDRKSFFGTPWAATKRTVNRGSLMIRTGDLRRSIHGTVRGSMIVFTSSLPYASLHNEGGTITVTPKMKAYFWHKFYEASGAITKKKDGTASKSQRNTALTEDAMFYKRMALMKVGSKISIPQRQFLGHHPRIDEIVREVIDSKVQEFANDITAELRRIA